MDYKCLEIAARAQAEASHMVDAAAADVRRPLALSLCPPSLLYFPPFLFAARAIAISSSDVFNIAA